MARAWKDVAKREQWTADGRFTLWLLDDWLEDLVETP